MKPQWDSRGRDRSIAKNREKIKKNILKIAKKKFAEAGYEATNIQDIANEAKINIAMISYYFGGKEQLYQEIFKSSNIPHVIPNYLSIYPNEPTTALRNYLEYMFKHLEKEREIGLLTYQELLAPTARLKTIIPYIKCIIQQLRTILQVGKEAEEFQYDSLSFTMHWIGSFIIFPKYQSFLHEALDEEIDMVTSEQKIEYIMRFLQAHTTKKNPE